MAEIKFDCEHCGQTLEAPDEMAGETLACPSCEGEIIVPRPVLRSRPGAVDPPAAPEAPAPAPASGNLDELLAAQGDAQSAPAPASADVK